MAGRSARRLAGVLLPPETARYPDSLDETVVHDRSGRPWLVCTADTLYFRQAAGARAGSPTIDDAPAETYVDPPAGRAATAGRYRTEVFYTARGGLRGFPTGHGEWFSTREAAVAGHRRWCFRVRLGEVFPDHPPDDPLSS